jgi:hypothetical protein
MASGSTGMLMDSSRAPGSTSFLDLRIHARPARSIFSNALNFCCSAIAALVRSPDFRPVTTGVRVLSAKID